MEVIWMVDIPQTRGTIENQIRLICQNAAWQQCSIATLRFQGVALVSDCCVGTPVKTKDQNSSLLLACNMFHQRMSSNSGASHSVGMKRSVHKI